MKKNSGLNLIYKNLGETPNEAILRYKRENPEYADLAMTYAGRLDPMAEGVLLVLSGDEIKEKEKYLGLRKTYVFEILWGFLTDSLDLLGLVSGHHLDTPFPSDEEMKTRLKEYIRKFEQKYPAYSSKTIVGVPLFKLARQGKLADIEIPKHEVEIFEAKFLSRWFVSGDDLLKNIEHKISLVSGDFRQSEILKKWQANLSTSQVDKFVIDRIEVTVSSGFYVRQFVSDIAESFGTKAVTFHIKRTSIENFSIL
ncbi:MAG TPA: hypothetical protein VJC13_01740 [Candidatus Paceibacterota bacterium]